MPAADAASQPVTSTAATFFDGGFSYNAWAFAFSLAGLILTLVGFAVTLKQLAQTRQAAEAARTASNAAKSQIKSISAVVTWSELIRYANEVFFAQRANDFKLAALRSFDLRARLYQARQYLGKAAKEDVDYWQLLITQISQLHEHYESAASNPDSRKYTDAECVELISQVVDKLSSGQAAAMNAAEGAPNEAN